MRSGAQDLSTGSLNVTVTDSAGALIPRAKLVLKDLETNDVHNATTKNDGTIVIPFLNPATYSLTVSKEGFASSEFAKVTITTNQVTNLTAALKVGSTTETVTVTSDRSPILDTTSNTLSTNLDMKQVQDLPTGARDVSSLAFLVPGAVDDNINNMPGGAVNISANGFSTMTNRNKSGGFDTDRTVTVQRLESTQEMTAQTGELDASKGGTAAMDIGFLTRRGTNQFHGELFEDYRSEALNANTWARNFAHQPRGLLIINDFGASVGGPLLKDRLFFFASLGNYRRPFQNLVTTTVPTPLALSGIYTYYPCKTGAGATCVTGTQTSTANVLQAGASAGCSTCTSTINPIIAADIANVTKAIAMPGVTITPAGDPNHEVINFSHHGSQIERFPTLRMDYNVTPNFRVTGTVVGTFNYNNSNGNPPYPGPDFAADSTSSKTRNYQAVAGFDWSLRPNIVNAFRVGYLYTANTYSSQGIGTPTPEMVKVGDLIANDPGFNFNTGINGFLQLHGGSLYPVASIKDDTTWSHGKHTISFGVEGSSEIDHYYNNQFVPYIGVDGIADGDPVQGSLDASVANGPTSALGDVEALYSLLNGRVTFYSLGQFVNNKTKQFQPGISFNLHERLTQVALFAQDSWKATPTLTLNAGLRWDFTGASTDETGFYTHPSISDLWGPSGQGNLFKPGTLTGNYNAIEAPSAQSYAPTYVHPEPTVGFAWNPRDSDSNVIGKLFGNGKSVIRGSFTFKNYTEGAQNFWNFGSNNGSNFNTYFIANPVAPTPGVTPGPGFYNAGSFILGGPVPATLSTSPNPFNPIIPESYLALSGTDMATFDPHIRQPYVESWEFGIQRQLTTNNVIEVRYVGNVSKDQWLVKNYNEVNIFENGFLNEFKAAQANVAATGSIKGPNPTPILDQAFKVAGASAYKNSGFINDLKTGQAGAMARSLAGNPTYLCSLIGGHFDPCAANGFDGTGTYPINFFQANPYAAGAGILEMGNYGFSNYNALQVDFRQNPTHGMQFDLNYTFSKGLGTSVQGSTAPGYYGGRNNSAGGFIALRNEDLNYFPSAFDVRHVFHASGTYDFPFGRGRRFLNHNAIANTVIGGWTIGSIVTWQSGEPYLLNGGTATFNGGGNSGIELTGVTASQLQHSMHARQVPGKGYKEMLDPKYLQTNGSANPAYITPEHTPGKIGQLVWLHDPTNFVTDLALTKLVPIYGDRVHLKLQGVFLNATNHPSWTRLNTNIQSTSFGTTSTPFTPYQPSGSSTGGVRNIELRANIAF